ncbi:MAG: alpha/beta hydrolase [Hyphomicrobiales bacterium]
MQRIKNEIEEEDPEPRDYVITKLPLKRNEEGENEACLLNLKSSNHTGKAVLYIHGFTDYFFQDHMARCFIAKGYDFYALELRRYGRALTPQQRPNYTKNINEYYEEIELALKIIREKDKHSFVVLCGHSTGGLISSLFVNDKGKECGINALILNSPFFEFNASWLLRRFGYVLEGLGHIFPHIKLFLDKKGGMAYRQSLHQDHKGEWNYDQTYKPYEGFPLYAGWVTAMSRAHRRVHKGLNIPCPVLLLHSDKSSRHSKWDEEIMLTDVVLDVEDMKEHAHNLGKNVCTVEIQGGMHDLSLSKQLIRENFFSSIFNWLVEIEKDLDIDTRAL